MGIGLLIARALSQRPPLRLPHEYALEERGEELYDVGGPRPASPVDRTATVLETGTEGPAPDHGAPPSLPRPTTPPQVIEHDPGEHRDEGAR
ncbi:hypothetical protein [Methylobacterium sp.]|uniref:hypothetical protein n=1 Tax=Methylobacterium sp. TaxID=409 RepID=UPI0025863EDF|nr:hypothetical protein [Methylobacterium sp.]